MGWEEFDKGIAAHDRAVARTVREARSRAADRAAYERSSTMTMEILERYERAAAAAIAGLSAVAGDEAIKYPAEHIRAERDRYARALDLADANAERELSRWRQERHAEADRMYARSEPAPSAAELIEADQLSRGMSRVEARNKLLPEAQRWLRDGNVSRARVLMKAAKLAGAANSALEAAIQAAADEEIPERIAAARVRHDADLAWSRLRMAQLDAKAKARLLVGDSSSAASASANRKMLDFYGPGGRLSGGES